MNVIAAVDNNWAIGCQNSLLVRIPRDQKQFREMTEGSVIVIGRKTLETFPQKQPLKNRVNIILSRDKQYRVKDAFVVHSMEKLLEELKNMITKKFMWQGERACMNSSSLTVTQPTLQK